MNQYPTLAFIGTGNMSRAIIGGLLANGYPADQIWATARNVDKLQDLADQGVKITADNKAAVSASELTVLSVKPQMMQALTEELAETIQQVKPLVMSVAAGITVEAFERWLGQDTAIVRCMPNTPSLVMKGASGLFANPQVTEQQKQIATQVMQAAGIAVWVDAEKDIDAVIAVSGSGPAYYFLMMEAMIDAGVKQGLSPEVASQLVLQTALGAAEMASASEHDPAELRRRVTSPNGTTEQAINSFEASGLRNTVAVAMDACSHRAAELAEELCK